MTPRLAHALALPAFLGLVACNESHSVFAPHGPVAQDIAALMWFLFAVLGIVSVIVFVAAAMAIRGPARLRGMLQTQNFVIVLGIAFPVIVLSTLLFIGVRLTAATIAPSPAKALAIEVTGEQWWWRVRYRPAGGRMFESANQVRIPVGRDVVFSLRSADVIHSFWIPSLAGKVDMIPGRTTTLRLSAAREGVYRGACAEYCGGPHAWMAFDVIAMPSAAFDEWLAGATIAERPAQEQRRGHDLFMQSGCGGCHTVAGTPAQGTIGPNLTTLGARRSIAAGRLPMDEANLARFIAGSQHIKPQNKMPSFGIFSASEMQALTAWLMALR
jgi:cytochrome c oxidase subunit 2